MINASNKEEILRHVEMVFENAINSFPLVLITEYNFYYPSTLTQEELASVIACFENEIKLVLRTRYFRTIMYFDLHETYGTQIKLICLIDGLLYPKVSTLDVESEGGLISRSQMISDSWFCSIFKSGLLGKFSIPYYSSHLYEEFVDVFDYHGLVDDITNRIHLAHLKNPTSI